MSFLCHSIARPTRERFKRHLSLTTGWWLNCAADAVPSALAFAVRAARDAFTRPIPGARPTGQRKRCSKTLFAFLSDAARAFAASMPLTRRSRSPQHSFNAGKTLHFALIGFVSNLNRQVTLPVWSFRYDNAPNYSNSVCDSTTASATMLTIRRTEAIGVRMCTGLATPISTGPTVTPSEEETRSRL